jgi:hypothetical protein
VKGELMNLIRSASRVIAVVAVFASLLLAQKLQRAEWGAPGVTVTHTGGVWIISGKKRTVSVNEKTLAITVQSEPTVWQTVASSPKDMLVQSNGGELYVRLADAREIEVLPYDTGFKTGVKIRLARWEPGSMAGRVVELDLSLYFTICLEGRDEDVVFDVSANGEAAVRQLDWPTALDAGDVDYSVLSNGRGNLLPRNWPKEFNPIRGTRADGKLVATDHSEVQSNVIESWSMSWWGFQRGKSAMMVIVETPDDAGYQFEHPAGGPTVIGPRWRATLGRFGYQRACRMCFFANGNYVDMAKRYRRYVMDKGLFVSLNEKITRTPVLAELIGAPQTRVSILRNMNPESDRYDIKDPSKNYSLTTFDERARQLRELKASGVGRALVFVSGWPHLGYDRQHPDSLPPPESAGGWPGLKRLADTCRELGYPYILHDQYRDYYLDAPSYDQQFAIHEQDSGKEPRAFPGTRFGDSKQGQIPMMRHWDGGMQAYLNGRFMLGHLLKNYQLIFDHGIKPQGIYLDVFGYVPPDEDFNPEHLTSRTAAMEARAACFNWSRHNLGIVATEAGADWVVPYVDSVNQSGGNGKVIPVPLYNLVYHDAVIISYGFRDRKSLLQGLMAGGVPEMPVVQNTLDAGSLDLIRQMIALHRRVALIEMTRHDFLDNNYRKERTTYADGTTVTVDWDSNTVDIRPGLKP